ncbi:cytochrome o ubiquinol oxidase subunit IV [Sphingomonas oligoaromativorans]|jgi:cytochrome o ubiquinol oxidase operon protein cyoD|uniref:cytochrome o ubiquinol oxidase subunit IV n=1 Tax=Sphingomonas oligoaromativorans TaxID=575322 RepID=UPI00141F2472|nr:cytochrome o ubiquinol oxidase subunit IV [Sphingomonas oligoaromativorans]NIJ34356.1 cytochrome o ubiquinol oxidase operon protein cyoD [Sphingomonas oligoaromativorans]
MSAHDTHASHGSHGGAGSYLVGFVLAVVLTVIPFGAVMKGMVHGSQAVALIMGAAVIQILVHLRYFLHIDGKTDRWTLQALIFTIFVLGIVLGGSLWVMHNMNTNMMPTAMQMPMGD